MFAYHKFVRDQLDRLYGPGNPDSELPFLERGALVFVSDHKEQMYELAMQVLERGGFYAVVSQNAWAEIAGKTGFSTGEEAYNKFVGYLFHFEKHCAKVESVSTLDPDLAAAAVVLPEKLSAEEFDKVCLSPQNANE